MTAIMVRIVRIDKPVTLPSGHVGVQVGWQVEIGDVMEPKRYTDFVRALNRQLTVQGWSDAEWEAWYLAHLLYPRDGEYALAFAEVAHRDERRLKLPY